VHWGRAVTDATVIRALFERAKGYSHKVSRTTLYRGKEQTVTNTVSYPPDADVRALRCFTGPKRAFFGRYGTRKFDSR
jgi:hypothetical protein